MSFVATSPSPHRTQPDHTLTGYPPGVPYIIGNEGCERFSFYGMKAILYVYIVGLLTQLRGVMPADATMQGTRSYHIFVAGVYAVPIVGGILADRLLGKYRTIMYLSVVYCLGHLALAMFESTAWQEKLFGQVYLDPVNGMYVGLFLICVGSGGIKPCVSAHVGDQFGKGNWHLLEKIFNAFYFIINFGSFFAQIFIPMIRGKTVENAAGAITGYEGSVAWAFGVPGILMGLATIAFWMGRKVFIHVPPSPGGKLGLLDTLSGSALFMGFLGWWMFFREPLETNWWETLLISAAFVAVGLAIFAARQRATPDDGFLAILFFAVARWLRPDRAAPSGPLPEGPLAKFRFWRPAVQRYGHAAAEGPVAVFKIVSVFLMVSVFWALYDQHTSTWIEQARAMNLRLDFGTGGWAMAGAGLGLAIGGALGLALSQRTTPRLLALAGGALAGAVILVGVGSGQPEGGYELYESQVPFINPAMIMIMVPYTTFGLYPLLGRLGFEMHPLRRMTIGMFMIALSFVGVAILQIIIDGGTQLHFAWQLIPYALLTLSEVMVSITGLEFAYSQAPKRMKSAIMGFFFLTISLGNILVSLLAGLEGMHLQQFFWLFAGLCAIAAVIFWARAKFYRYQDYPQ